MCSKRQGPQGPQVGLEYAEKTTEFEIKEIKGNSFIYRSLRGAVQCCTHSDCTYSTGGVLTLWGIDILHVQFCIIRSYIFPYLHRSKVHTVPYSVLDHTVLDHTTCHNILESNNRCPFNILVVTLPQSHLMTVSLGLQLL